MMLFCHRKAETDRTETPPTITARGLLRAGSSAGAMASPTDQSKPLTNTVSVNGQAVAPAMATSSMPITLPSGAVGCQNA